MTAVLRAIRYFGLLAWRVDRRRFSLSGVLVVGGYLATPLIALMLKVFINATEAGDRHRLVEAALATSVLLIAEIMLQHFAHLYYFELAEEAELLLLDRLLSAVNGGVSYVRSQDPLFADQLAVAREDIRKIRTIITSVLEFGGVLAQAAVTVFILGLLYPVLFALPLAATVPVYFGGRAQRVIAAGQAAAAGGVRLTRHFLSTATSADLIMELRLCGAQTALLEHHRATAECASRRLARAHRDAALLRAAGNAAFAAAYGGALWLMIERAIHGRAATGDVVLVVALAVQVSAQIAGTLNLFNSLSEAGALVGRLQGLAGEQVKTDRPTGQPAPSHLATGLRLENVAYHYPGVETQVLREVSLDIPAGSTVALVGENGAGKSTLIRLLCGLDAPSSGRILLDGLDLTAIDSRSWQDRVAPLFQDFARFQLMLRENVGLGNVPQIQDDDAVTAALESAGASAVCDRVPGGLDGLLGHSYGPGAQLSTGQWQRLGLARAAMRHEPLLVVLDEPAAALDASAEHALVERSGSLARSAARCGAITIFTSHRFTSARSADLIIVLSEGTVVECGDHKTLLRRDGLYAELFHTQARAYL